MSDNWDFFPKPKKKTLFACQGDRVKVAIERQPSTAGYTRTSQTLVWFFSNVQFDDLSTGDCWGWIRRDFFSVAMRTWLQDQPSPVYFNDDPDKWSPIMAQFFPALLGKRLFPYHDRFHQITGVLEYEPVKSAELLVISYGEAYGHAVT